MKQILLICGIVFSFCLLGCAQQSNGDFELNGKLTDVQSKTIYLKQIDFNTNVPIAIDSFSVKADGAYTLRSKNIKGQHLFIVSADSTPYLFINDNSRVTMNLNGNKPLDPEVGGSEATSALYRFLNEYREKDSVLMTTFIQLDSISKIASATAADDSLKTVLEKRKVVQIDDMNNAVKSYVKNTGSAVGAFYVLRVMAPRSIAPKDMLPMAASASARFKEDGSLAGLASQLKVQAASDNPDNYPLLHQQAPELAMQTPDGRSMKISDFRGKYLLVDFWASWCSPCRAENPNVVKAYNMYKDKNFTILGVSLDKDKAAWQKAIMADNLTWNHMSDLRFWESAAVKAYQFDGIPFNVLLDPSGKIIANNLHGKDLENKLAEVLK